MKRLIATLSVSFVLFAAVVFFVYFELNRSESAEVQTSQTSQAAVSKNEVKNESEVEEASGKLISLHTKFTETSLSGEIGVMEESEQKMKPEKEEIIVQETEIWINQQGHFRLDVLSGVDAGNYMVWNGENVYQYDKYTDQLLVTPETETVTPHMILSQETTRRLKEAFLEGKVGKENNQVYLKRPVQVFTNEIIINGSATGLSDQYPTIYKTGDNKEKSFMYIDQDLDIALKTETKTNGRVTASHEVTLLETGVAMDEALLIVEDAATTTTVDVPVEEAE